MHLRPQRAQKKWSALCVHRFGILRYGGLTVLCHFTYKDLSILGFLYLQRSWKQSPADAEGGQNYQFYLIALAHQWSMTDFKL